MRVWEPYCRCKTTQIHSGAAWYTMLLCWWRLRVDVGTPHSLCPVTQRNKAKYGGETDSVCSLRSLTWAMWYLLDVLLGTPQILYVALMQRRQRPTRAYVARLHSVEVVPCLMLAWRQPSHAGLRNNENPWFGPCANCSRMFYHCQPQQKYTSSQNKA